MPVGRIPLSRYSAASPRVIFAAAVLVLSIVAGCLLYYSLQGMEQTPHYPIVCEQPIWDFGVLRQDTPEQVTHSFYLKNLSAETVQIAKVVSDCGCIVAAEYPTEIAPGTVAKFPVKVDSVGPPGPFDKRVHVMLDTAPGVQKVTLSIRGLIAVSPAMYVLPQALDFGTLGAAESRTRRATIARYDGTRIGLLRVTSDSAAVRVAEVLPGDAKDSHVELEVCVDSSLLRTGEFRSFVYATTDHQVFTVVKVPVLARVEASPPGLITAIFVDRLARGNSQDKTVGDAAKLPSFVETVTYDGDGPITVQLLHGEHTSQLGSNPIVRISRRDEGFASRVCRGVLIVKFSEAKGTGRIPITVYLED